MSKVIRDIDKAWFELISSLKEDEKLIIVKTKNGSRIAKVKSKK